MTRTSQGREVCKFMDGIVDGVYAVASPRGALRGIPDTVMISTTRVTVTGWPVEYAGAGFSGLLDGAAGTIEIPNDGLYRVMGSISGILTGGTALADLVMFLRPSGVADLGPIAAYPINPNRTNYVAGSFNFVESFTKGQKLSLQLDCSTNLNESLMFMFGDFEVSLIEEQTIQ